MLLPAAWSTRSSRVATGLVLTLLSNVHAANAHDVGQIQPPEIVRRVEPAYPNSAVASGAEATVIALLTVDASGSVSDVEIIQSGGTAFDAAIQQACVQWRFKPATRDGEPISIRIRIKQRFSMATINMDDLPVVTPRRAAPAAPPVVTAPAPVPAPEKFTSTVRDIRPHAPVAASDHVLDSDVLNTVPVLDAADLLASAPGVYVARPDGPAMAQEIFLRGFDASHGQDIEFLVDGVPVNQPSHIHGQGYADLNFVIPETVQALHVTEGVFNPRQGDFAVAGSMEFRLGVKERGLHLKTTAGSFGNLRQLMIFAPQDLPADTFGAAQVRHVDGFGKNRGGQLGSGVGQFSFRLPYGVKAVAHLSAHGARFNSPGVVRRDDVAAGRVDFYGVYGDPSASAQSALAARAQASISLTRKHEDALSSLSAWLVLSTFHLRQNYTGYLERSEVEPTWVGRGDLIEQQHQVTALGGRASHRFPRVRLGRWGLLTVEAGLSTRTDLIGQTQGLLQAPQNEIWDRRVDAQVRGADLGVYLDADLQLFQMVRLRVGGRSDILYYDVDDARDNVTAPFRVPSHLDGYRRTSLGLALGPRGMLELAPLPFLPVFISYGEGYRSPQAIQLQEGENAPYTKVRSFEGGIRLTTPALDDRFTLTLSGYVTTLSQDLAFDPSVGKVDRIGPSSRRGAALSLVARPLAWLLATVAVTGVHATLDAPPPASPDNPSPPYVRGQLLPYVPPLVIRGTTVADRTLAVVQGIPLRGRLGGGVTFIAPRPLPHRQYSAGILLVDMQAAMRMKHVEVGVDIYNLLDRQYATAEYVFTSDWRTREIPSRTPARHTAAGAPRTVLFTLGLHFF